mmetsp:Transcript_21917/g.31450  ORF Transcript_21917/g.31450 Transcript_21917/m.31450 type:complete len:186 (+) Transcript_21917:41-598(+)
MHDRLIMYDSLQCSFVSIKKPPRSKKCSVCGENPKIKNLTDSSTVSNSARGPAGTFHDNHGQAPLHVVPPLPDNLNITCRQYKAIRNEPHVLIDVRVERQFEMCHLENAINIPFHRLEEVLDEVEHLSDERKPIFCICRRGILSLKATQMLNEAKTTRPKIHSVRNIVGGVTAWAMEVDQTFPQY